MAWIQCRFYSNVLQLQVSVQVILPDSGASRCEDGKYRTLWLFHGMSDDDTVWMRRTSIERYAAEHGLAVVMPAVHRSYYADMLHGYRYWTFIEEELFEVCRSYFPLSERRENNFVAGNSMGGYGAFKLAFTRPDRMAAAISLSGAVHLPSITFREADFRLIFGGIDRIAGSGDDLFVMAEQAVAAKRELPRLFQYCGRRDVLYEGNAAFRQHCERLGIALTYREDDGDHVWEDWDRMIVEALAWMRQSW